MKKCLWIIRLYFDDEKKNLMFQKEYNNVADIQRDFEFRKSFLYDCCRDGKMSSGSQKISCLKKYKRLEIIKRTYRKNGNVQISQFGI